MVISWSCECQRGDSFPLRISTIGGFSGGWHATIVPCESWYIFRAGVWGSAGYFLGISLKKFFWCTADCQWWNGAWDIKDKKFQGNVKEKLVLILHIHHVHAAFKIWDTLAVRPPVCRTAHSTACWSLSMCNTVVKVVLELPSDRVLWVTLPSPGMLRLRVGGYLGQVWSILHCTVTDCPTFLSPKIIISGSSALSLQNKWENIWK